ncbi:MAG: addiction module antidote protein [Pseudomonadota bacterium]
MMSILTTRWDSAEHLKTESDMQLYLEACLEEAENDPEFIIHALNVVARAKSMNQTAENTNQIYKSDEKMLFLEDKSDFSTVVSVARKLGFKFAIRPAT